MYEPSKMYDSFDIAGFQYHDGRNRGVRSCFGKTYRGRIEYSGILL